VTRVHRPEEHLVGISAEPREDLGGDADRLVQPRAIPGGEELVHLLARHRSHALVRELDHDAHDVLETVTPRGVEQAADPVEVRGEDVTLPLHDERHLDLVALPRVRDAGRNRENGVDEERRLARNP
jgi:hypothetical protein